MEDTKPAEKKSRKKGCLIAFLAALAFLAYAVWSAGEQSRNARQAFKAIQPGMSCWKVPELLTGRHFCHFLVNTNDHWQTLSKDDFARFLETSTSNSTARIQLHFMGTTPARVSFCVNLDSKGAVTNLSNPYSWD